MTRDLAQDTLAVAQLAQLSHDLQSLTQTTERLAVGITNHVLFAGTVELGTGGFWTFSWGATCGSIEVHNVAETDPIIVSPGAANVQPRLGPGVHYIPAGIWRSVNVDSRMVTLWGTAGQLVGVQALTVGGLVGGGPA
jgi:hypothetical protein